MISNSQHEPFFQQIELAEDPRLALSIYADWLEEVGGDPLRVFACRRLAEAPRFLEDKLVEQVQSDKFPVRYQTRIEAIEFWSSLRRSVFEADLQHLNQGVAIAHLHGRLHGEPRLQELMELLDFHGRALSLVLDLADAELSQDLLKVAFRFNNQGGKRRHVVFCQLDDFARQIFYDTNLVKVFGVQPTLSAAVEAAIAAASMEQENP